MAKSKWIRISLMVVVVFTFIVFTGCMKTVTKYRTETVPEKVTKYRTEQRPVQKMVETPYEEQEKVPEYKKIGQSRLNPGPGTRTISFIPFTTSTASVNDGVEVSKKIENAIKSHSEYGEKFRAVNAGRIRDEVNKENLLTLTPQDVKKLKENLGLELLITGHLKRFSDPDTILRLEAIDTGRMVSILKQNLSGTWENVLRNIQDIFFGRTVFKGYVTKTVTKYKKEYQTVYETHEVPYETTEYVEKQVSYEEKEVDWLTTIFLIVIGIAGLSGGGD